jgi:hypothetical protein
MTSTVSNRSLVHSRNVVAKASIFLIILLYYSLAFGIQFSWTRLGAYGVTGDEPHYLVMASGIANFGTFEQTQPYKREFETREIYPGLAPADARPDQTNTHSVMGPHGLYNVHNVGLPLLLAPALALAGTAGAKALLVLISGLPIFLLWSLAGRYTRALPIRLIASALPCLGFPLVVAANQIYPDVLSGIISLSAIIWLMLRPDVSRRRGLADFGVALALAFQPWLQIKYAAAAVVAALALAVGARRSGAPLARAAVFLIPLAVSLILLGSYNSYAFGHASGPYQIGALEVSLTSLMVLLGLHFDQFQGIFLQNPAFFLVALFIVPYARRDWLVGVATLVIYAALVVPNALHPNWYGGSSFAGRFAWSGAIVLFAPLTYALATLTSRWPKQMALLIAVFLILQAHFYAISATLKLFLYNQLARTWLDAYGSFYAPFQTWMPAFYNVTWAFNYQPNVIVIAATLALVILGTVFLPDRSSVRIAGGGLVILGVASLPLIATSATTPVYLDQTFAAANLPTLTGSRQGTAIRATAGVDPAGLTTVGPYLALSPGEYDVSIIYASPALPGSDVGKWEASTGSCGETLTAGDLPGTAGTQHAVRARIVVTRPSGECRYEVRTTFLGEADLTIETITIAKVLNLESPDR